MRREEGGGSKIWGLFTLTGICTEGERIKTLGFLVLSGNGLKIRDTGKEPTAKYRFASFFFFSFAIFLPFSYSSFKIFFFQGVGVWDVVGSVS